MSAAFRFVWLGDAAAALEFEPVIDIAVNQRVIRAAAVLDALHVPGVRDIVPTYRSVGVYFDPLRTDANALKAAMEQAAGEGADGSGPLAEAPLVEIPVRYGGDDGPDLAEVATLCGLSESDVVRLHSGGTYTVFMLGFLPGFAYLGLVDPRIAVPRREDPRLRVRAGSVGIAGRQTGVYPVDTPGGWRIIGWTPHRVLDPAAAEPFLLQPGDRVRFTPLRDGTTQAGDA